MLHMWYSKGMFNDILQVPLDSRMWYLALFAWAVVWKGLALWKAAHREQRYWFVGFLVVNTLGILEILYIYVFSVDRKAAKHDEK